MNYNEKDIKNINRDYRIEIYSIAETLCLEKIPQSQVFFFPYNPIKNIKFNYQVCFDISNTTVDLKTCRRVISEFEKCYRQTIKAKLAEKGKP